jgi:hypothetical protein
MKKMDKLQEQILQSCHYITFTYEKILQAHKTACRADNQTGELSEIVLFPMIERAKSLRDDLNRLNSAMTKENK